MADGAIALKGQPGDTLADMIYASLKAMIIYGNFRPAERLLPADLAARFGVSPTPVKDALTRLAAERFIVFTPRRGFRVREPSPRHVLDLWKTRLGLEEMACEGIVERLSDHSLTNKDLNELDELNEAIVTAGEKGSRHVELNAEFHDKLIELSGNEVLAQVYRGLKTYLIAAWVQHGSAEWRARFPLAVREHRQLVAALRSRDLDKARATLRHHLNRALAGLLSDLVARGDTDAYGQDEDSSSSPRAAGDASSERYSR